MSNYYCLITSLPKLSLEDNKLNFGVAEFRDEYLGELSSSDRRLIRLFYLKYDNANLLKLLSDENAAVDERGGFTREQLLENIRCVKEEGKPADSDFPEYMVRFLEEYFSESETPVLAEDRLTALYYDHASKCRNPFIARWFKFNRILNNLLIALSARRLEIEYASSIVGNDELSELMRTSGARDFGLASEIDFFEEVMKISETENLFEREKQTDAFRWEYLEENSFFHYFSVERIFVFIEQLSMVERWLALDKEKGNEMFRGLIDSLKDEVRIPSEFR